MSEFYPIFTLLADSPELIEQLGSKPKFWFRWGADEQPWLFKFARDHRNKPPDPSLADMDAPMVLAFPYHFETDRKNSIWSRNARLAALRSSCVSPRSRNRSRWP